MKTVPTRSRRRSVELLPLPDAFGAILLVFTFILTLSPYLHGADFGVFKVPTFSASTRDTLTIIGPVTFILVIALYVPVWKANESTETIGKVSERRYGQHREDVPAASRPKLPSALAHLQPEQLASRTLLWRTRHSRIEECTVLGNHCVVKSTRRSLVDYEALEMLVGRDLHSSFQGTSVSIATPEKLWVEGNDVCELYPFLDGITLYEAILRNRYRLKGSYLGLIFDRSVRVLAQLHDLGILHRDVNPMNMFLTGNGDIILLDPSFACRMDHQTTPVENPAFSAPEQISRQAVPQSDFYSLAATTYFLANDQGVSEMADIEALRQGIFNIDFGAFGKSNFGHLEMIDRLLSYKVDERPRSYRDLLLTPGTYPPDTTLFGVLDLEHLGYLLLSPSRIIIGDEGAVKDALKELLDEDGMNSISDVGLRADVSSFLGGANPWLA
jgi:serine/threonine protein kinase